MARTGIQLLADFGRFIGDDFTGTTTSAGAAGGTTLIDTSLRRFGDDFIRNWYLRPTGATNQYAIRRISSFSSATGTCTVAPAFAAQAANSEAYGLHRYDPAGKFTALDEARLRVFPDVSQLVYNDTLTGDGRSSVFAIPSALLRGPLLSQIEQPLTPDVSWNFLTTPLGDATTGWTATSATASTVSRGDYDLLIPKYDDTCTRVAVATATNGTYTQAVASMTNSITAALAAGRRMTLAAWVYCRTSGRVTLELADDTTTTSSATHGGGGWQLLTVEKTVLPTNATTLTAGFDVSNAAGAVTFWWNRAWLYFGTAERVRDAIYAGSLQQRVRRDDTTQQVYLDSIPPRGYQVRLIGRDVLSALGTTAATQVTNTMEVDEATSQVLLAEAAKILFQREGLNVEDYREVAVRIGQAEALRRDLKSRWAIQRRPVALKSMWVR